MSEIDQIISRMKEACGLNTDTELAVYPKLTGGNIISTWKKKGSKPFSYCEVISKKECVTMDWLLTGEGIKNRDHVMSIADAKTLKTIELIPNLPGDVIN